MRSCTEIKSDLYNISGRLREIDPGYYVVRAHNKGRFEVHNRLQRGGSFCLAVPYPQLDPRTLSLVRRTRFERAADFLAEMERENQRLQKKEIEAAVKKAEYKTEELLK